jgi:hypothetical protein
LYLRNIFGIGADESRPRIHKELVDLLGEVAVYVSQGFGRSDRRFCGIKNTVKKIW